MAEAINYARVTIGKRKNENGEPLVEAGGIVVGTVGGLRDWLDQWDALHPRKCTCQSV